MNRINWSSHNWLAYKINNGALSANVNRLTGRVVDLGCGAAPYKTDILKIADQYIGVDWGKSFHSRSNVDVLANLVQPLPFEDKFADAVVSFQVLEHLAEPLHFLEECHRVLQPQGIIFITVPFMWHVHEAPHDYFRYTRYGLEYLFKQSGFTNIQVQENTGFWQMWILKFNYHSTRFARGPLKYPWIPIWWVGQTIAPILDKYDKHPQETGSYTVLATKP